MPIAWTQGTDDPSYPTRQWCSSGQVGTKMYIMGGYEGAGIVRIYDMATDTWSSGASFSAGTSQPANQAPAVGTKLYVAGGGKMHIYDTVANTWAYYYGSTNYNFPSSYAVGTDIYVTGGWSSTSSFYKFNTLTNVWSALPSLPFSQTYMGSIIGIDSDNFRLFGSTYGTGNANNDWGLTYNYNYKVSTGAWDTSSYAPIPLEPDNPFSAGGSGPKNVGEGAAGVVRIGNNIHVIGGWYTTTVGLYHNRIYNIDSNTWSDGLPKPSTMVLGATGFYQDKLYTYNIGMEIYQFFDAPPPPDAAAAAGGFGKNIITWDDSGYDPGITFNIYWSFAPGVTTSDTKISGATTPYTHSDLTVGTPYYYIITAYDATYEVESIPSDEVTATPTNQNSDGRIIW